MFKFFIELFRKNTVVGLTTIEQETEKKYSSVNIKNEMRLYKNVYSQLFTTDKKAEKKFQDTFTDPIAYHLLTIVQNQTALYSV